MTTQHQSNQFGPGDYVRLTDGYFQNYIGPIREISSDAELVTVALTIFGREHPVEIAMKHLVPAEPDQGHYMDPGKE